MDASKALWAMFHAADMGEALEEVVETGDCKVLRMKNQSSDGLMTIYRVLDGVYLCAGFFQRSERNY